MKSVIDILGAGWLPTYPANRTIPPLLPIDHILVSPQLTATSVARFSVPGSDHLGLKAKIACS
jgi:endonuclease/exonuclease/phosphatase family metal-dependent hydrolase